LKSGNQNQLEAGDRVRLSKAMDDLIEGELGTVLQVEETYAFKKEDADRRNPILTEPYKTLGIQFDRMKFPAIGRMIHGKYERVIDHCDIIAGITS
jgi:hypothetical protein